jgi:hypothetical protein
MAGLLPAMLVPTAVAQSYTNTPVFQFAAFYNLDLDFSPGQVMTVNGKVHVNGNFWMYPQAAVTFNDIVEASVVVTNKDNPNDQQNLTSYTAPTYNGGSPRSGVDRLNILINTTNVEAILNLPPAGLGVPNDAGYMPSNQIYLYNECDLIISNSVSGTNGNGVFGTNLSVYFSDFYNPAGRLVLVTNDVQWITTNGSGAYKWYVTNKFYSFLTDVAFYDFREGKIVQSVQIDVAKLGNWLTNSAPNGGNQYNQTNLFDKGHGIDSIFVYNSVPPTSSQLPAVRVVNGQQLPSRYGLTIATPMPLYVLGNYNIQTNAGGSQSINTNNTYWTWPAALMGDAITILSGNWSDANSLAKSGGSYNPPESGSGNRVVSSNVTINAACFAGIVSSTFTTHKQYSGGLENFFRLQEDWSGDTFWYNGSIVAMFPSLYATNFWIGPSDRTGYPTHNYTVPTRKWGFDRIFLTLNKLPPLTPLLLNTNFLMIVTQPQSQIVASGNNATFNVSATGSGRLGYQWSFNGTNISKATNTSLTLSNVQTNQAGNYAVLVTNASGSILSSNAVLTVIVLPPSISTQPTNQTIFVNGTATFSVTATGSLPLSYQWNFNTTNIEGATNTILTLANVQVSQAGNYAVQVTNSVGSILSSNALLAVSLSPSIFIQPTNQTLMAGNTAIFSVTAGGLNPLNYQWQFNGTDIVGATNLSLMLDNVRTNNAGSYQVIVTNAYGSITSSVATLTVIRSMVVAWGDNTYGQIDVPAGMTNVVAIAAGEYHSLALQANGTVVAWGDDVYGQANVPAGLMNVVAIAAGDYHSLALKNDGTVVAWGDNSLRETSVPPGLTNVVAITAGAYHSLALQANGTVVGWGYNELGETQAPAGLTNVVAIAAGLASSLVLQANGTVVGWGYNELGETQAPAGLTNVVAIAAGLASSLVLQANGVVVAWGNDSEGETNVPAGLTNVVAIAACQDDSLALQANGTVVAWGNNGSGQTNVPARLTNVVAIAAGGYSSLALKNDGTVVAWGANSFGQSSVPAGLTNVVAIAAGNFFSLALENDGSPVILRQAASQTALTGATVLFNVTTVGRPQLSYQWQKDGINLMDGGNASGTTTAALTLTNVQTNDAGIYTLVVTNDFGSITSSNAALTVLVPPSITTQPADCTNVVGATVNFNVVADGTAPLIYQWQSNGTNLVDATNATLTLNNITLDQAGTYSVTITNLAGSVTSSNAILSVYASAAAMLDGYSYSSANGFQFQVAGVPGFNYAVQESTNLIDWMSLITNTSPFIFVDTNAASFPQQFYRTIYVP